MNNRFILLYCTQMQSLDYIVNQQKTLRSRRMLFDSVIDGFFHILVIRLEIVGRRFLSDTGAEVRAGDRSLLEVYYIAVRVSTFGEDI